MSDLFRYGSLRDLRPQDAEMMLSWMHLPKTKDLFLKDFGSLHINDVLAFIARSHEHQNALHLAIVDDSDDYLGTISLKDIVPRQSAEYAISMAERAQGTGAAGQGTSDLLDYAYGVLRLHRVYLNVRADNLRAVRFYEKMGFSYEGTARDAIIHEGGYVDLLWYSMLDHEWEALRDAPL